MPPPKAPTGAARPTNRAQGESMPDDRRAPNVQPMIAFYIFLVANILAAIFSPIQDCDEIFNYWEPTHYLNHGSGLQTWEYSPEYAIRSWAYTSIHAIVIFIGSFIPFISTRVAEFYFLRVVLAFVCAVCETKLYSAIARMINTRVAIFFLMITVMSPGMYHASIAYLPSTFTMYTTMLGFSAFMDWHGGIKTARGIFYFALGSLLGWPFAGALVLPFVAEEVWLAVTSGEVYLGLKRLLNGAVRATLVLIFQVWVDSIFYRKFTVVPLNIVLYNIFSGDSRGPNIYGVEPWTFYIRNLALNFNTWFFLALASLPLLLLQHVVLQKAVSKQTLLRGIVFTSPFYLWLAVFTLQPHKEERFMYPAYPALVLNAALSLHVLLANFGSSDPKSIFGKIPPQLKLLVVSVFILFSFDVGALRTIGTMTAYSAPLSVYRPLQKRGATQPGDIVCLGKEWYRFPSSYFLPPGTRARFVKSEFAGLLPGEFSEATTGFGYFPATHLIPAGMNDENIEDPGKHVDLAQCNFVVDSHLPSVNPTALEPNYMADTKTWEKMKCSNFLDASRSSAIGRILWVPDLPIIPQRFRRVWGEYCLLRRRV